jgi:type IV secretory pathway protease TraF
VWVLGDNAVESRDSRSFGAVERTRIVGKAWLRY